MKTGMMNHDEIRELPELYVLGALTEDERQILEAHLTGCRACAATVRELVRVTEGLGRAVDPRDPPASLRARVLSAARSDRAALSEPVSRVPVQPEFSFLLASDGWQPHAVPGVSFKELRVDHSTRQATLLVALEPGARYPGHHHAGAGPP